MRWVTAHRQQLLIQETRTAIAWPQRSLGFEESITRRAVHELLFQPTPGGTLPLFPALLAARAAVTGTMKRSGLPPGTADAGVGGPGGHVLPAGDRGGGDVAGAGLRAAAAGGGRGLGGDRMPGAPPGVGAVVALVTQRLSRVEVRRLQLAAERGSGVGLLLRPNLAGAGSGIYAAATRWLVAPAPGERAIQRWHLRFIHGYGGHVGQSFLLEKHRASGQTNFIAPISPTGPSPATSAGSGGFVMHILTEAV